jgi:putative transposase
MIDRSQDRPAVRQCPVLGIASSTAYYTPEPVSAADLVLMRRIDELHLEFATECNVPKNA